jgi:hypothetical protein
LSLSDFNYSHKWSIEEFVGKISKKIFFNPRWENILLILDEAGRLSGYELKHKYQ